MKKGISLIVLVITIIVIIILAGAVILSLADNNPINAANKAVCLSDVANFKSAVALDLASKLASGTTGVIDNYTVTAGSTVDVLKGKLLSKYGITATVGLDGAISFAATDATKVPADVVVADL